MLSIVYATQNTVHPFPHKHYRLPIESQINTHLAEVMKLKQTSSASSVAITTYDTWNR